jgi:hypothetical protein
LNEPSGIYPVGLADAADMSLSEQLATGSGGVEKITTIRPSQTFEQ